MDICCLHIVVSTKTPPLIGVSGGIGIIGKPREQKIVENQDAVSKRVSKCRVYKRLEISPNVDCPVSVKDSNGNGSDRSLKSMSNGSVKVEVEGGNCSEVKVKSVLRSKWRRSNDRVKPSLDCLTSVENPRKEKSKMVYRAIRNKNGDETKLDLKHASFSEVKKGTKSLSKWLSYGGYLPSILQSLDTVNDLDEALKPWEKTLSNKERSIILKEQVNWERALEIFDWFKKKGCYELNVIHYNIMFKILGKARRWDHVQCLWKEMQDRGIAPTNATYGTLIDVYNKGGRKEEALLWLEQMKKQGIEPDEVTMGTVVQTYKKSGEFEKAEQFFKTWSAGKPVHNGGISSEKGNTCAEDKVCLSSYTYNTLIDTYGKAGQLQHASDTFSQMLKEGIVPTTVTFNTMIHICGNNGKLEEVASLMKMMDELQCPRDTRTYNILISVHVKHDNIDAAASYYSKMKEIGLMPDHVSYRTLLYAFSTRHMITEAEALISEMDKLDLKIDEYTQSAITRMFLEAGMLQKAWSWFDQYHLEGNMTSECYSANIDAFGEHGHILEAEKAFICSQQRIKLSVLEFNVMIKAYGKGKRYDKACGLFDSMEQHKVLPDICSYSSLVQILSSADLPYVAKPYLRKMHEAGLVLDCISYSAVISSFIKLGKLDMAEEQFKEMVGLGVEPDIYLFGILINAFADAGNVKTATVYANKMKSSGLLGNSIVYNSLIKLYTKVGYLREAEETYRLLRSSVEIPEVYSSNCMINLYSERGMVAQAEEIFEELKQIDAANEFAYAMMLCMYRRVGRMEKAISIANKMRELELLTCNLSYNNVIGIYALDGRLNEAVESFWEMLKTNIQPDDSTFRPLGAILMRCGASKEAVSKLEVTRRDNAESGLQAWMKTLWCMVCVDKDAWKSSCPYDVSSFSSNVTNTL